MRPPDGVGRCQACAFPARQMLYDGLCLHCWLRCHTCAGRGRVRVVYRHPRLGWPNTFERRCQVCDGSGRRQWAA